MYLAAQCFIEDYENTLEAKISSQIEDEKVSDQSICVTYTMFFNDIVKSDKPHGK